MGHKIYFATDHAGFELKNELVTFVREELGYEVVDCGAEVYDEQDDFTDFIAKAAQEVSDSSDESKAIMLGGSGQGEAMLANIYHNVRATVFYGGSEDILTLSRTHNNANVLSLGARFLTSDEAKQAVSVWLATAYVFVEKYNRRNTAIEDRKNTQENVPPSSFVGLIQKELVPSLPSASFFETQHFLETLQGTARTVQIDIVDGVFAPFTSWPFTEVNVTKELLLLQPYASDFDFEFDCMCMHPRQYLDTFVKIGVKRVIIHIGTTKHIDSCITHARMYGYEIGLGIRNATDRALLEPYADRIDFIQVMGIAKIGTQGQPFDPVTVSTITALHTSYPNLTIAVDGAVTAETIPKLLQAGATRFAPGSAITKAIDPVESYKQLRALIGR